MTIAADFKELHKTYLALAEELGKAFEGGSEERTEAAAAAVLANRECLSRIEQMNAKVLQISAAWQKQRALLDPGSQDEARHFLAAANAEALRLKEICDIHAQKLRTIQTRILKDIADLGKGSRLLHSLRPVKGNYPKFIDSTF
jgi:septation ring formation regulator EzrA